MTDKTTLPEGPIVYQHALEGEGFSWRHFNRLNPATHDLLTGIDPMIREALLQEDTRPRATRFEQGLLVILRGVNHNPGADPEDLVTVRIWLDASSVTTLAAYNILAVDDLHALYLQGNGPQTTGRFLSQLTQRLVERVDPVVVELDESTDLLEEQADAEEINAIARQASTLRHMILQLRRYLLPQREAVAALVRDPTPLLNATDIFLLRETTDDLMRINESLDTIRERLHVIYEQLAERRSTAMNQRLFVLATVSAIFLPMSFFTGLLGVNVGGIPGANSPFAFAVLCSVMGLIAIGLLVIFRRLKWL